MTSVAIGALMLFALSSVPIGAILAGIIAGAIEGNAVKGFAAALAAGIVYATAVTVASAGAGIVALTFEFYYAYVVDAVLCTVGGLLGGWISRALRRRLASRGGRRTSPGSPGEIRTPVAGAHLAANPALRTAIQSPASLAARRPGCLRGEWRIPLTVSEHR